MCFTSDGEGVPQFGGRHESECSLENCEVTFDRDISAELRSYILDQTELYCKMCGICPGDIDDLTGYRAKFNIEFIADTSIGGQEELSNLRTLCSTCDEGMKSIVTVKPTAIWLLSQVRRAGHDEQLAVLKWLREKFKV
jgi:hypothetical protein